MFLPFLPVLFCLLNKTTESPHSPVKSHQILGCGIIWHANSVLDPVSMVYASFTSFLPIFWPLNSAANADGTLSSPSETSSTTWTFP
uniref:Secreted protein n=1 Tax=Arundo donax TaxID=35708 RepID=A0A0A8ZEW6_ARUDO